jgi:hypothetical protein
MTQRRNYLGDSRYQTPYTSDFKILDDDTGPPESHAILLMNDGTFSIRDKADLNDAGEFHDANGMAIVLLKSGTGSKNVNTEHQPWRLKSLSSRGWCICEDPSTGTWVLAPPRDQNRDSDRVLALELNTKSVAFQCPYLTSVDNLDHYHDENDRVEIQLKSPNSEAYAGLLKYNEQLRNQN